jgi:hypothetical protein
VVDCIRERDGSPVSTIDGEISGAGRQLPVESLDNRFGETGKIVQGSDHWFSIRVPDFCDRYAKGLCNLGFRRTFADERQYGFLAGSQPPSRDWLNPIPAYPEGHGHRLYTDQSAMLTYDVQIMEGPKQSIPTFVWFQIFDNRSFGRGKPLYEFASLIVASREGGRTFGDGEIRVFGLRHAVTLGERGGQKIESTSNSIDVRTDLDIEFERQRLVFDRYYDIMRSWRISLFDGCAHIEMEPGVDALFEGFELGYGPINACLSV